MIVSVLVTALCVAGIIVSTRMQRKAMQAARGELAEPSVVQSPRARLFGGTPNSAVGIAYYALMIPAAWLLEVHVVWILALVAAVAAAALSVYLAYSLLYVTRMPCAMCWTGHAINWLLLLAIALLH